MNNLDMNFRIGIYIGKIENLLKKVFQITTEEEEEEAVKKATLVLGTVTMLAASTLVYNTGINLEKTNDATKFYLESGNNIDKAAKMYQDKWDNSLVSKANNSINDILGNEQFFDLQVSSEFRYGTPFTKEKRRIFLSFIFH